ncbi:ester cyclase [Hymenobacter psoromatis]|nr:ester cyclase [Hymenobacter psoromatis]
MTTALEQNKAVVQRFNQEVIEQGNRASFQELMAEQFINHAAPAGADNGPNGMWNTFQNVLRPALSDMQVIIYEQVAEGDLVTTRKAITGTHTGPLLGLAPTGKFVTIDVLDMVRVRHGKYVEHWGVNTLPAVMQQLVKS